MRMESNNCMWYEQGGHHCMWYGDYFTHAKMTANEACCACGGGIDVPIKSTTSEKTQTLQPQSLLRSELLLELLDFQYSQESNNTATDQSCTDSIQVTDGSSAVIPSIVGGAVVDPPRKYKVSYLLFFCSHLPAFFDSSFLSIISSLSG